MIYLIEYMANNLFACLSLLSIYHVHVNGPWIALNMVYGISKEIIPHKILNY
jgi:hypothetical protein